MEREYSVMECKRMEAWMSASQGLCTALIIILILCGISMTGLLNRNDITMGVTQMGLVICIGFTLVLIGIKTIFRHIQIVFARKRIFLDDRWC